MSDALLAHRDDGPIAALGARLDPSGRAPSAALTLSGAVLLALGVALDSRPAGVGTLLGLGAFLILATAGWRPGWRFGWVVPPLLRVAEYGFVAALATRAGAGAGAYALLAAVAFHHYDIVYRLRHQRAAPPVPLRLAGLGWDGRMLAVALLAMTGSLERGLVVLAAYLAVLFVGESIASWRRRTGSRAVAGHAEGT